MKTKALTITSTEFALLCGVHLTTVGAWVRNNGLPVRHVKGKALLDLRTAVPWLLAKAKAELEAARTQPDEAKARKAAADASLRELELAERRKEVVSAEEVAEDWNAQTDAFREGVLAIPPNAVQSGLIPKEREFELEGLCLDALRSIEKRVHEYAEEGDDDAGAASPGEDPAQGGVL